MRGLKQSVVGSSDVCQVAPSMSNKISFLFNNLNIFLIWKFITGIGYLFAELVLRKYCLKACLIVTILKFLFSLFLG